MPRLFGFTPVRGALARLEAGANGGGEVRFAVDPFDLSMAPGSELRVLPLDGVSDPVAALMDSARVAGRDLALD